MKLKINIGNKTLTASLADNATAQDFASVLPLNVSMKDLFGREKYGDLPKALSEMVPGRRRTKSAISRIGLLITSSPFTTTRMVSRYPHPALSP
jgi:hypothetical protein